jgi:hypothetical protein
MTGHWYAWVARDALRGKTTHEEQALKMQATKALQGSSDLFCIRLGSLHKNPDMSNLVGKRSLTKKQNRQFQAETAVPWRIANLF